MTFPVTVNDRGHHYCARCNCESGLGPPGKVRTHNGPHLSAEAMLTAHLPGPENRGEARPTPTGSPLMDVNCTCECHTAWRLAWAVQ